MPITTEENIKRYKEQLKNIGFSFDWSKEVRTCDQNYYKWTQWVFIQLFNSWYDQDQNKAVSVDKLIERLQQEGNANIHRGAYFLSQRATDDYECARSKMRRFINAGHDREIVFYVFLSILSPT